MGMLILLVLFVGLVPEGKSLKFSGSPSGYARFPSWSGCPNASFSFEFRTRVKKEALLWYVDDGGHTDFCIVGIDSSGRILLHFKTVTETNGALTLQSTTGLNDGRWHRVEVRRRRMETLLTVDAATMSAFSFGSDFDFGSGSNSFVYLGGLPDNCMEFLTGYAETTSCFQTHFSGNIRNVIYNNCSCLVERVAMLESIQVQLEAEDRCEVSNSSCSDGCICMNTDITTPRCDCVNIQCATSNVTHYVLPMDEIQGHTINNPSGLDSKTFGSPSRHPGIIDRAIDVDGKTKYIEVSGPGHRHECFGDLMKCPNGYTVALWVNFKQPGGTDPYIFLSNGGHSTENHGIAMYYSRRILEVRFKRKDSKEWSVRWSDILPYRWCHIAATWHLDRGLFLYINGEQVGASGAARVGGLVAANGTNSNAFVIGRPNDVESIAEEFNFLVDDFNFWSVYKSLKEIREIGPLYRYYSSMDSTDDARSSNLETQVRGHPEVVSGKIGTALKFTSGQDFLEGNDVDDICLGNLALCRHGITISMWIMFTRLENNTFILSTGNRAIQMLYRDGKLRAEVWDGNDYYWSSWGGAQTNQWYFLELSWLRDDWMKLLVDLRSITDDDGLDERDPPAESSGSTFYVARGGSDLQNAGSFVVDELEVWYGDRETLTRIDFLLRGKPTHHQISMDAIRNNQIVHPSLQIKLFGKPTITKGRIDGALRLNGIDDSAIISGQKSNCLVNLDFCRHGILLSSWLRLDRLNDGMDIFTTDNGGLRVRYVGGRLIVRVQTSIREWRVGTGAVEAGTWVFFEVLWEPHGGLGLMMDNELVARNRTSIVRSDNEVVSSVEQFYIGNGSLTIDDFEFWYGSRDYLIAFEYLSRGRPQNYLVYMDRIRDSRIPTRDLNVSVLGNPSIIPGKINSAVRLDGRSQYIDLGTHTRSCLGNLELCKNGFTGSIFLNFRSFQDKMFCLSSGGGVQLFVNGRRVVVLFHELRKQWRIETENLEKDRWYFIEFTWRSDQGLLVYVDNRLIGRPTTETVVSQFPSEGRFLIGKGNPGDQFAFADISVDETEFWYGHRVELIAFDYILRDSVTYIVFTLERADNNRVFHPDYVITLNNGAALGPARVGNGVVLRGSNQYMTLGDQRASCLGKLERCKYGLTLGFFLNPAELIDDSYLISGGQYAVFFRDNKLWARFTLKTKTWELSTDQIFARKWQRVDISWDAWRGLQIYINNSLVSSTDSYTKHSTLTVPDYTVNIGRPSESVRGGKYARATIDEIEVWFVHREHLKAFDVVSDDIQSLIVDMDGIADGTIQHPTLNISMHGTPVITKGVIGNAILLNGVDQFIQFGRGVMGTPDYPRGFTLRFKVRPNKLQENVYFVSSNEVDVLYKNSRLVVRVLTRSSLWEASFPGMEEGKWYQMEASWHLIDGLALYVNDSVVWQMSGVKQDGAYNRSWNIYIGKAGPDLSPARYANATFDDFQFWKAKREYLIPDLINPAYDLALIGIANKVSKLDFDGSSWLRYDFSSMNDYRSWSNISLRVLRLNFEMSSRDGVIWSTETSDRYVVFGLEAGKPYISSTAKVGNVSEKIVFDVNIVANTSNEFVLTQKNTGEIELIVNGRKFSKTFSELFQFLSSYSFYIGGISRSAESQIAQKPFSGFVSEAVIYDESHSKTINLVLEALLQRGFVFRENLITFCANAVCENGGICRRDFCDCNLTSYVGQLCSEEAEGYQFGSEESKGGIAVYNLTDSRLFVDSDMKIAFGFMTMGKNGTLFRLSNSGSAHYINIGIANGSVVVKYDVGNGVSEFGVKGIKVSDGSYHRSVLIRNETGVMLFLDGRPVHFFTVDASDASVFRSWDQIELGAKKVSANSYVDKLYGIIAGVYINGHRIIDETLVGGAAEAGIHVSKLGDAVIADHPFRVKLPEFPPTGSEEIGGGGGGGIGWSPDGEEEVILIPDDGSPHFEYQMGGPGPSREEGGRAAGVSGAMLGLLMVASSLMWALYRLKPGVLGHGKLEIESDANISGPMLHVGRKSVSDAGASDVKVSTIAPNYDSVALIATDTTAKSADRSSFSMVMSPLPASGFQSSALLMTGMESENSLARTGASRETFEMTTMSGGSASTRVDSNFGVNSNRGQERSQIVTTNHQKTVEVVTEFHSVGGMHGSQETSRIVQTGQMTTGKNFAGTNATEFTVSTNSSQNRPQVTAIVHQASAQEMRTGTAEASGDASGAVMIFSNFGGNTVRNQENVNTSLTSHNVSGTTVSGWNQAGGVMGINESNSTISSSRNTSTELTVRSNVRGVSGGAVGQDASNKFVSGEKITREVILETGGGGTSAGQGQSKVTTFVQKDSNSGGTGKIKGVSTHTTTSELSSYLQGAFPTAVYGLDTSNLYASDKGTALSVADNGGTSLDQQKLITVTTTQKISSNFDLEKTKGKPGAVVVYSNVGDNSGGKSTDRSQVDVAFRKEARTIVVGPNVGNASNTGLTQETSELVTSYNRRALSESVPQAESGDVSAGQFLSLNQRAVAAGVDISKYDLTRSSPAGGSNAPSSKELERSEEMLRTSVNKTFTTRTVIGSDSKEMKPLLSSENKNLVIDNRKGAMTLKLESSTARSGAKNSPGDIGGGSESFSRYHSLDRTVASIAGVPPKTVKVQSPVQNSGLPHLLISSHATSTESSGVKINVSMDRSSSTIQGQPPRTLKVESPVSPSFPGFSESQGLNVPSLDRSSSFVKGQPPKKLRIESSSDTVDRSGTSTFSSHSTVTSRKVVGFGNLPGGELNIQLPSSSLTTRKYQIQNVPLISMSPDESFKRSLPVLGSPSSGSPSDAERMECIRLTANGQFLVTGSVTGPPQVWNMKTGERARKMEGENHRSTDLHLVNDDALLIGRVNEAANPASKPNAPYPGKLQIWDFESGKSLSMPKSETYTVSSLLSDGKHVALGRIDTDSRGNRSVVVILWDVIANQPKRKISYKLGTVTSDVLTFVDQSDDKRFVVAGFANVDMQNATYMTFDLTASSFDVVKPTVMVLEADVKNSVVLRNHQVVTGTKVGGLVFWSLRTGKLSGQLVAPPSEVGNSRAHRSEVKDLAVSKDGRYLVSASADTTLRLWNLETQMHARTFTGHTDEVTCCAISIDNELIVSGSRDHSILLWRLADGVAITSIGTNASIVRVLLSNDKQTIAALADQNGIRKLVMMQVVRTKVRRQTTSHGESPETPYSPEFPPGLSFTPYSE